MQITQYTIRNTQYEKGFTLVELLVALIVSSIILAAVATLAFAISSANVSTDDISSKQAHLRYATMRISELIRHCKLICKRSDSEIVLWSSDGGSNDPNVGRINVNELVYIRKEPTSNLCLYQFPSSYTSVKSLAEIDTLSPVDYGITPVTLISECTDVQFNCYDSKSAPIEQSPWTWTRFCIITFKLIENSVEHQYQINNALRCWAGNLLNGTGTSIVSDDD